MLIRKWSERKGAPVLVELQLHLAERRRMHRVVRPQQSRLPVTAVIDFEPIRVKGHNVTDIVQRTAAPCRSTS